MASATELDLSTRRWRRVEYERLVELGMFVGERLVHLVERAVEVHRWPRPVVEAAVGAGYGSVEVLRPPATVTPLAAPTVRIAVTDLLP